MYRRFLNDKDYLSIVTEEGLSQLIRNHPERLAMAEEAAEESIREYLSENYEIEAALEVGKQLAPYDRRISYPIGSHFYLDDVPMQVTRNLNGIKEPDDLQYWRESTDFVPEENITPYSQRVSYTPGQYVRFADVVWQCTAYNGPDYSLIRIPGVQAWQEAEWTEWEPNLEYECWDVVRYGGQFYTFCPPASTDDEEDEIDWTTNPHDNERWGQIGEYTPDYAEYDLDQTEYVVHADKVWFPIHDPNPTILEEYVNIKPHDPRSSNIKKHLLRLAIYELHKLISPANVSSARITDYETSIQWLRDAGRLKINPGIERKIDHASKPVADFAIATFMRDYDPMQNPWHI